MPSSVLRATFVAASLILAACSANHNSIYRVQSLDTATSTMILVDGKQRAILASPWTSPSGQPAAAEHPKLRYCAEPSPDVFSVLAQSASGSGTFGQGADPKAINAAASAAFASAEQGTTIQRTQTVNMLREVMFRTCERAMNGDLSPLEMSIQAIRDQRLMVATLAIEQLTATVTPVATSAGAGGAANAGASAADAVVRLSDAQKALATANTAVATAQAAYDKLEGDAKTCSTLKTKKGKGETLTADETTKDSDCGKALKALDDAKATQDTASKNYESLKAVATGTAPPAGATATPQTMAGGAAPATQAALASGVATVVQEIVKANYDQDEFLLFCLKIMAPSANGSVDQAALTSIRQTCTAYVQRGLQREAALQDAKFQAQIEVERGKLLPKIETAFDIFWQKVAASAAVADPAKIAAAVQAVIAADKHIPAPSLKILAALKTTVARADALAAFDRLPTKYQRLLTK